MGFGLAGWLKLSVEAYHEWLRVVTDNHRFTPLKTILYWGVLRLYLERSSIVFKITFFCPVWGLVQPGG